MQKLIQTRFTLNTSWGAVSRLAMLVCFLLVNLTGEILAQGPGNKPPSTKPPGGNPAADLVIDPETLPPGFKPPPKPLAIMELELPIATKEELEKLKKDWGKFARVKNELDLTPAGRKVIENSIRWRLASMTAIKSTEMKEYPNRLPLIHTELVKELALIGRGTDTPAKKLEMSKVVNDEVLKQIPELLKNNFYVRLHSVLILSEMDYAPAYQLLLQVVQSKDIRLDEENGQPEAIKIAAVNGLIRILRFVDGPVKDRTMIANAVITELQNKDTFWWYQRALIGALRYCNISGVDVGDNNKPFVVDALVDIVKDSQRHLRVRSRACYALGRVPLPAGVDHKAVVFAIADFSFFIANGAAFDPTKPVWKRCFADVLLAFEADENPKEKDLDAEKKIPGGLLARAKAIAQPVHALIVPIFNDILNDKAPNAASLQKLETFVDPANRQ